MQRLVNNGSFFENQPTGTITLISPNAVAHLIPMEEIAGTSHTAFGIFATPFDNAFQADTVVFQRNGYPETFPITSSPRIVGPPPISQDEFGTFLGGQTHAAVFNFSNGSCPPEEWAGTFETLHTFDPDNDGVADVDRALAQSTGIDTALIQYGSNQVSFGTTWVDPYRFELVGSGDDYTEFYSFTNADVNSGTYTHTSGDSDECTWDFTITGGLTNMVTEVNDELDALAAAAVTTSSPPETTTPGTTEAPATTPDDQGSGAAATTSTVTAASDDDGGGKGGLVFIIIGILLVIAALTYWWWRTFMMPAPWQHPCWPQYVAWQKAKAECEKAKKEAAEKRQKAKEATKAREDAEKKKDDHCKKYAPACGPEAKASSGGRTVTRDDLWIQSQWAAAAWAGYEPGVPGSAQAVQDQWESGPTDEFRDKAQKELDAAKAAVAGLDKAIEAAREAEAKAKSEAEATDAAAAKACADAEAAKAAYDACIGAAAAGGAAAGVAAGGAAGADTGGGTPPTAPPGGGDGGGKRNCAAEEAAYEAAQQACDEARDAADAAQEAADDAADAAEEARENLEDYCEE